MYTLSHVYDCIQLLRSIRTYFRFVNKRWNGMACHDDEVKFMSLYVYECLLGEIC